MLILMIFVSLFGPSLLPSTIFLTQKVFRNRTPDAIDLVSKLLEYTPSQRITPLQACAHRFFDELRELNYRPPLKSGQPPPLFNFSEHGMIHWLVFWPIFVLPWMLFNTFCFYFSVFLYCLFVYVSHLLYFTPRNYHYYYYFGCVFVSIRKTIFWYRTSAKITVTLAFIQI